MLELFKNFVCYFLEISIFYLLASMLSNFSISEHVKRIFTLPLFALIAAYLEYTNQFSTSYIFINIIIELLFLYLLMKHSFLDTVILFFLSYLLTMGFQVILMFFLPVKYTQLFSFMVSLIGNTILLILSILGYLFLSHYHIYIYIQKNSTLKLILGNLFMILFGMACYSKLNPTGITNILFILFICIIFLFMLNWDILKNQKQLLEKEKELEIYQTYIPVITELIDQVRIRQHQFDNHIQAIQMLPATHKDYTSLSNAIINYSDHIAINFKHSTLLKLNCKLLAGFLFSKYHEAETSEKRPSNCY